MVLFEFFHYKKQAYKAAFDEKFPSYSSIKDPYFSKAEKDKLESLSANIDNILFVNSK